MTDYMWRLLKQWIIEMFKEYDLKIFSKNTTQWGNMPDG